MPAAMAADVVEVSTRTIGAVAVPGSARDAAGHLRPVSDAATLQDAAPYVTVKEVLSEVHQNDDEWMYVLEKMQKEAAKGTPDTAVTAAVEACLAGDAAAARKLLAPLTADDAVARTVSRLHTVRWLQGAAATVATPGEFVRCCDSE